MYSSYSTIKYVALFSIEYLRSIGREETGNDLSFVKRTTVKQSKNIGRGSRRRWRDGDGEGEGEGEVDS